MASQEILTLNDRDARNAMSSSIAARHLESALKCHERGEYAAAEHFFQQALAVDPRNVSVLHSAGILALQTKNFSLAAERLKQAIELGVNLPETYLLLGRALKAQGDLDGAIANYQRALKSAPGKSAAHISLGIALKEQGRLPEAVAAYREALLLNPSSFEARVNLANALQLQDQLDEALAEYEKAAALKPENPQVHYNIGKLLRAQKRDTDAAERFHKAVLSDPEYLEAYYNLANTLTTIGHYQAAIDCFRHLCQQLEAGNGRVDSQAARQRLLQDSLTGIAAPLVWSQRFAEAMPILREALRRDPDSVALNEYYLLVLPYLCEKQADFLDAYVRYQRVMPLRDVKPASQAPRQTEREKLKIGYMSGDFRDHSISFFIEPILANHDRQAFEILCYSNNVEDDHVTERLKSYADSWLDIKDMKDSAVAQRIAADEVDILVDLSGRTVQNRLGVFAGRPAPLQLGYLGYPTYTGVPQIAYRMTDAIIDPVGVEELASERPLRLPHTMFCYRPPAGAPEMPRVSIRERGFVCFGSFNSIQKLSPAILAAWARILNDVPGSHLLLKAHGFNDAEARQRTVDALMRDGIEAERIIIRGAEPRRDEHLVMYAEIDIALDTFPYNGATTTCEALWMGVPVVTLCGETHSARMGASLLTAVGLQELVTQFVEEYIDAATSLATNEQRLDGLHATLRQRVMSSSLCDEAGFTRRYEKTLSEAWRLRAACSDG